MEINCWFYDQKVVSKRFYGCTVDESFITDKDDVIKEFTGNHEEGKSHKDVESVSFIKTRVDHFPRGLQKHFPNLTHLIVHYGGIRDISKSDLKGLERLVGLYIQHCHLMSLPDDLFSEMPRLREVSFRGNKIEFASAEFLKPFLGREEIKVDLRGNKSIDAWFWPGKRDSLESLEELMQLIDEKCIKASLFPLIGPLLT